VRQLYRDEIEAKQCEARCEKSGINFIDLVMSEEKNFLSFTLAVDDESEEPVIVINQWPLANHPSCGLVSCVKITIRYSINFLLK